jgi:hypothetical protein
MKPIPAHLKSLCSRAVLHSGLVSRTAHRGWLNQRRRSCNARSCSHLPRRRPLGGVPTATGSDGHNIVFYFRDYTGSIVEYSAEEEIILNDATYAPRVWPTSDPRAADEWNLSHAPAAMK